MTDKCAISAAGRVVPEPQTHLPKLGESRNGGLIIKDIFPNGSI